MKRIIGQYAVNKYVGQHIKDGIKRNVIQGMLNEADKCNVIEYTSEEAFVDDARFLNDEVFMGEVFVASKTEVVKLLNYISSLRTGIECDMSKEEMIRQLDLMKHIIKDEK